jgi:hypothetical protein
VRVVQGFIGAATAVVVFFVVLRLLDGYRRDRPASVREALAQRPWLTATLAALAVAVFDSLVFYCGEFLTETWYIFFLLVLIYHLLTGTFGAGDQHRNRYGAALLSGGILGMMALLRPAALFLTPPILVVERKRGAAWRSLGLTLFAAAFVIHPWTLRNAVLLRAFVPISTNTGVNLYIGHNPHFGYWSTGNKEGIRQATDLDEVEESRYFMRLAIEYAVSHPWRTVKNTVVKFYNLYRLPWTPSFLVRSEDDRVRSYKPWPWPGNGAPLRLAGIGWLPMIEWGFPFLIIFVVGLWFSFRDRSRFLAFHLFVLFHTLGYMVFFGRTRFAVPMMPLFCIFAAYGLVRVLAWSRIVRFSADETDDPPSPPYEGGQKGSLSPGGRGRG